MSRRRKKTIPTELVTTTIESLSHDGRGIAHIEGKTVFIDNALPQENVNFQYTYQKNKFDEGKAVEILAPSPLRETPKCPYYELCGGCCLQHLSSQGQLEHKQNVLLEQLKHFGQIESPEILPPLTGPIWGYRHKARLGVRYVIKKESLLVGFREKNGRYITDIENCPILHPGVGNKIKALRTLIQSLEHKQDIPQIEVAIGDHNIALVIRHLTDLTDQELNALSDFAKQENFDLYLQPGGLKTIHKIYPKNSSELLSYTLPKHGVELFFHPTNFTQVNPAINQKMIDRVIDFFDIQPDDEILDLFCGLGNFTLPLAKYAKQVIGVEGEHSLVERAQQNAKHNQLENVEFHVANLAEPLPAYAWVKRQYDKILLDPPRSGAIALIPYLAKFNAKTIIYISCNPATLARDVGLLVHEHGYQLQKTGIMDMFPHTGHVESIAVLTQ